MASACVVDEIGNGDSAHSRRKGKKKWVQLPLGGIPLTYPQRISRQPPTKQLSQRDIMQSATSDLFFNAWKGKKGSDLFSKKEMNASRVEQPLLCSVQSAADDVSSPNNPTNNTEQKEEDEMLEKALQESMRTAQQEEADRLSVLKDIANISEDEQLFEEHGIKNATNHPEDTNNLNREPQNKHTDGYDTNSSELLLKKKTFISYPVKQDTKLLSKTTLKQFPSDQNVGSQRRPDYQTANGQQRAEKMIRHKANGSRLSNHNYYNLKNKNRAENFSKSGEINNNNATCSIKTMDGFQSSVKRVMSRSNFKNDNLKTDKILIENSSSVFRETEHADQKCLKTKNGHEHSSNEKYAVSLAENYGSKSSIIEDPAVTYKAILHTGDSGGSNVELPSIPVVKKNEIASPAAGFLVENKNICVLLNTCNRSLDVENEADNMFYLDEQRALRSHPEEEQVCENNILNEISTFAGNKLQPKAETSSMWGPPILESHKDETNLPEARSECSAIADHHDGRKEIYDNSDSITGHDFAVVKESQADSEIHTKEHVSANTYQSEFREIVKSFLKSKENEIIDLLLSQFIAERVSVGQSAAVQTDSSQLLSTDELSRALQEELSSATVSTGQRDSYNAASSHVQEYSQSGDQYHGLQANSNENSLEGLKRLVKQVITAYPDVKEVLLEEDNANLPSSVHPCDSRQSLDSQFDFLPHLPVSCSVQHTPYPVPSHGPQCAGLQFQNTVPTMTEPQVSFDNCIPKSHFTSQVSSVLPPVIPQIASIPQPHIAVRPFVQTHQQRDPSEHVTAEQYALQEGNRQIQRSTPVPLQLQPQHPYMLPYQNSYLEQAGRLQHSHNMYPLTQQFHPAHVDVWQQYQWAVDDQSVSRTVTQAETVESNKGGNGNNINEQLKLENGKDHEAGRRNLTSEHQVPGENKQVGFDVQVNAKARQDLARNCMPNGTEHFTPHSVHRCETVDHLVLNEASTVNTLEASQADRPCINTTEAEKNNSPPQTTDSNVYRYNGSFAPGGPFTSVNNGQRSLQQLYPPVLLPGFRVAPVAQLSQQGPLTSRGRGRFQLN